VDEFLFEGSIIKEVEISVNHISKYNDNLETQIEEIEENHNIIGIEIISIGEQLATYKRIQNRIKENIQKWNEEDGVILNSIKELSDGLEQKLQKLLGEINESELKQDDLKNEIYTTRNTLKVNSDKLVQSNKHLSEYQKQIFLSDIDTLCQLVDPKGNLTSLMGTYLKLCLDGENSYETLQTKLKIHKILKASIMNS
jgi:chromosome segregation ATPase